MVYTGHISNNYPGDVSIGTAKLDTTKILLNSIISTPEIKFCTADVTNFFLNTPMDREEYMQIPINLILPEIICEYNLLGYFVVANGLVLAQVNKVWSTAS
jgi:hypothetical protein